MSRVEFNEQLLDFAIKWALIETCNVWVEKIVEITPRDPNRMPNDPTQKVTWNLKRSIWYEKVTGFHFKIWTMMDDVESYTWAMEFWTENIPARPFLRKWINDNKKELERVFVETTKKLLR
jgi:HK97 gp10 family phage protein